VPLQTTKDPMTFTLGWKVVPHLNSSGGVPPKTLLTGFTVMLPQPDSLYEHCHWLIRFKRWPKAAYVGALRPEGELDVITTDTGTISGRVTDQYGAGIQGVNIFVWHSALGALTGRDGTYRISKVPVGARSLAARAIGFDPCDRAHVRVAAKHTTTVEFRLTAAPASIPCAPYITAKERIELRFPADAVDTRGARLGQDTLRRAFVAPVHRNFRNSEEERLIRIAEETYPPAEAVLSIAKSHPGREALSQEKRLWWYGEFDGVRLPYAVTMDAVRYYLALTQALGRGDTRQTNGIRMKRSEFSYFANISTPPSTYSRDGRVFKDVYVVDMGLRWSNYCGSLCACAFHLDRTVVLRRDGTVLCVFGDQKPMVIVS